MTHVHFMGIGGSGISAASILAKKAGFVVSGCDMSEDTPYLDEVKAEGIKIFHGHDAKHLRNTDILAITPAVIYQNAKNNEINNRKINPIAWQKFVGDYLQTDKYVICIAGTHGKSTITSLVGRIFENDGTDPTVLVGANVIKWGVSYRFGKGKYFVIEADEYNGNFLNYSPNTLLINNIEYDHPDYFKSEQKYFDIFEKFIGKIKKSGKLIVNLDSKNIDKLMKIAVRKNIKCYGYTISRKEMDFLDGLFYAENIKKTNYGYGFRVKSNSDINLGKFIVPACGMHNITNSLAAIVLSYLENISNNMVKKTLYNFEGVQRRLELIKEKNSIKIYDDYAHHPTAIRATLDGLRQKYKNSRLICIVEPHTYSRTKYLLKLYKNTFPSADKVIIAPIYKSRDSGDYQVNENSIVDVSNHKDIMSISSFNQIINYLSKTVKANDIVVVMGAGNSYKLARQISEII